MNGLLPLILSAASRDIGAAARHTKRKIMLYALMGLFLLSAYVSATFACGVLAVRHFGPVGGALVVTLAFIGLALFTLVTMIIMDRTAKKRAKREALSGKTMALATAAALLPTVIKSKGLMAVLVATGVAVSLFTAKARREDSSI